MQSRLAEIRALDADVVAVSVDSPEKNAQLAQTAGLNFALLSDAEGAAMDAYGLRHAGASIEGGDVARPAVFIIDRDGKVAWRSLTDNWRVRVRPETILDELRKIP